MIEMLEKQLVEVDRESIIVEVGEILNLSIGTENFLIATGKAKQAQDPEQPKLKMKVEQIEKGGIE